MIEGTPVEHHADETGHTEFKPSPFRAGTIDCQQCPWQDPPSGAAQRPTEATEALADVPIVAGGDSEGSTGHTGSLPLGALFAAARAVADRHGPGATIGQLADHLADTDPGPVPDDQPDDVPPLDLRARIANALERNLDPHGLIDSFDAAVADVHAAVSAGADFSERTENTEMTPAQALAYLLDLPEWARLDRLATLLDQAHNGTMCHTMGHSHAVAENLALRIRVAQLTEYMTKIGRLGTPSEGPMSDVLDHVGQLAAEALTGDQ